MVRHYVCTLTPCPTYVRMQYAHTYIYVAYIRKYGKFVRK